MNFQQAANTETIGKLNATINQLDGAIQRAVHSAVSSAAVNSAAAVHQAESAAASLRDQLAATKLQLEEQFCEIAAEKSRLRSEWSTTVDTTAAENKRLQEELAKVNEQLSASQVAERAPEEVEPISGGEPSGDQQQQVVLLCSNVL